MDFTPSSAQQMLVSTAREFLRRHCPPERVQAWALDERGFDEKLWRQMAELGWPGLLVSPELGGSGGPMLDVVLLVEQMGYACLPGPFIPSGVVVPALPAAAADRLGAAGHGGALLTPALEAGALARTAEMVGGAQRILDLAVEHARTRVQGGRPIGGYQAIQHACADLVRDVDTARGLLYLAAWKAAEGLPAASDVAMAKAHAAESCVSVARRGHQIFGAIGYCGEHPLHLIHNRLQAAALDFGDAQHHLETVARSIGLK